MGMEYFYVGKKVPEWATGRDGCVMEYNDVGGLTLMYFLNCPIPQECHAFDTSEAFKISFTSVLDVGFFCVKVGKLDWSDCAFSPNIYDDAPVYEPVELGKGYALNLLLIDASNGEIKSIRTIGLGHQFSCKFREWCLESLKKDIRKEHYQKAVSLTFSRYTTAELVDRAWIKWEL